MPDAQSHFGISVLRVTPQQLLERVGFAAEVMNMSWVDWLLWIRVGTQEGVHGCREGVHGSKGKSTWQYMVCTCVHHVHGVHGVGGIMGAQAALQSRCSRDTRGWSLAGLPGSWMSERGTRDLTSFILEANIPYCLWSSTSHFLFCCWAVSGCKEGWWLPKAGEMGT